MTGGGTLTTVYIYIALMQKHVAGSLLSPAAISKVEKFVTRLLIRHRFGLRWWWQVSNVPGSVFECVN